MSGHSKWSTIKHKKAALDSKKGKAFGEVARMIRVAVAAAKSGDPEMNPGLRLALEKARAINMPKENVSRAIDKGLGKSASGAAIEEVIYEAYGPGGVGIMIWTLTDNRNRTGAEIRSLIDRAGGSLGGPGSASYLFELQADGSATVKIPLPITEAAVRAQVENLIAELEEVADVELVVTNLA